MFITVHHCIMMKIATVIRQHQKLMLTWRNVPFLQVHVMKPFLSCALIQEYELGTPENPDEVEEMFLFKAVVC